MKIAICAIGRARDGPEAALVDDYLRRAGKAGRGLGLGPFSVIETDARRGLSESDALRRAAQAAGIICALDERGEELSSPGFAALLGRLRDAGRGDLAFVVGGADGLDDALRETADHVISFGRMVWPHLLARAMLAEQLYRATQILSGTPYHRA